MNLQRLVVFVVMLLFLTARTGLPATVPAATVRLVMGTEEQQPQGGEASKEAEHATRELVFKWINFGLLVAGLAYVLRKPMREFFAARSADLKRRLEEGEKALDQARFRLQEIEERMKGLEAEIAALKASALTEAEAERGHLQKAAAEDAERILAAARLEIDTATRVAKIELKTYAAEQSVQLAEEILRQKLDESTRAALVNDFLNKLGERRTH